MALSGNCGQRGRPDCGGCVYEPCTHFCHEKAQVRGGVRTSVRVESETKSGAESAQRIRPLATVSTTAKGA